MEEKDQKKTDYVLDESTETPYSTEETTSAQSAQEEENGKGAEAVQEGRKRGSVLKAAVNAVLLLMNGFVIALIIYLFLAQPENGDRVKPTIQKFSVNSDQYYDEHETYEQINANVHVYQSEGRPD